MAEVGALPWYRMQSIEARKEYRNSFACVAKIFRDEGVLTFWSGALPRLVRLTVKFRLKLHVLLFF